MPDRDPEAPASTPAPAPASTPAPHPAPEPFALDPGAPPIRLGDLLKVVYGMSGGEAKVAIQDGHVTVDGAIETRRGRRLRGGEVVWLEDEARPIRVDAAP